MIYEYSGFLKTALTAPDQEAADAAAAVVFTHEDLAQWSLTDQANEKEWQQVPVHCDRREACVRLEGRFEDVRRIDNLRPDDPSFWVALSSRNWRGQGFPMDVLEYPVAEITYRCATPNARPAWLWSYEGGEHFDGLRPTNAWRTIARLVPHFGFPRQITSLTVRLFSGKRTTEAIEVSRIRFRALTPHEAEIVEERETWLAPLREKPHYPVLDTFMPFGTYIAGGTAKRMAQLMDISLGDYWRLAFEDMVRHYHNSVTVEEIEALEQTEWRDLLVMADSFNIRVHAQLDWPLDDYDNQAEQLFDTYVRPTRDAQALFAWSIRGEPPEHMFENYLKGRAHFEQEDPTRPLTVIMRNADSFPLYAPFLPAAGISHFKSQSAWDIGSIIDTHLPLQNGQQFWLVAPTFTYATDTPTWYTCPEMRLMLNLTLAHGGRGWFAHTYHNVPLWMGGAFQRSLTGPFLTFSDLWAEIGLRVERLHALTPLFLQARPATEGAISFRLEVEPTPRRNRPRDVPAVMCRILSNEQFSLYYIINNDIVDVTPVNLLFEEDPEIGVYDVSDYVRTRQWQPMDRRRHIEMFPGQGRVILAGPHAVCQSARRQIAERMLEDDSRQIAVDLGLARRYDLPTGAVQQLMETVGNGVPHEDAENTHEARNRLIDLVYGSPHIYEARSKLIEVSAAICGCDGALCRLVGQGKVDQAHELGEQVLSVARELTHLRLELREGKGGQIRDYCNDLARRTLEQLQRIRSVK
ncbi:MAG: hypothetical protein ACLFTT_15350 [Candidatus Hydrogenedentota bacterium]